MNLYLIMIGESKIFPFFLICGLEIFCKKIVKNLTISVLERSTLNLLNI